ncbi:MAG: aldo/keto reductase, partial [Clostridia bacterium]|nr:aldo/keto reductase [Clostridia bacterium]
MKRSIAFLLCIVLTFALAACKNTESHAIETDQQIQAQIMPDSETKSGAADSVKEQSTSVTALPAETSKTDPEPTDAPQHTTGFNFKTKTVTLNNGLEMPILGIGMFSLSNAEAENSTYWALKAGFRLIDTARIYGNEAAVGRGLQRAIDEGIVTREEVFITTKMWTSDFGNGDAAIDASLKRLGVDYIDLMILHHSQPSNDVQAYEALERAVADGKLKSIGLSNYYTPEDFDRLVNATTIPPALLQNETHPYHQSGEMKEHIAQYGTVLESWFPLGGRGNTQTLFNDETIRSIAAAHG